MDIQINACDDLAPCPYSRLQTLFLTSQDSHSHITIFFCLSIVTFESQGITLPMQNDKD